MVADMNHLWHKWLKILVVQYFLAGQSRYIYLSIN